MKSKLTYIGSDGGAVTLDMGEFADYTIDPICVRFRFKQEGKEGWAFVIVNKDAFLALVATVDPPANSGASSEWDAPSPLQSVEVPSA